MICVECLSQVTTACETKRKCIASDTQLKAIATELDITAMNTQGIPSSSIIIKVFETESFEYNENSASGVSLRKSLRHVSKRKSEASPLILVSAHLKKTKKAETFLHHDSQENDNHSELEHSKNVKEFFCDFCCFVSKGRKKNLERHILAVHMKSYKFSCSFDICSRQYTTQTALKLHCVRDHDEVSPYKCEKCNQKFSCESLLKIHNQRLSCRPRKYKTVDRVLKKSLSCPHCEFKTAHQFSLSQHINLIHLNIRKTFKCSHCKDTEFTNRISLTQHMQKVHNISHFRCPDCDQLLANEDQLKIHKESMKCNARKATDDDFFETEAGIKCNLCKRNYKSKKEWITHYFNHHKFKTTCDVCGVQLSTYASLKNHKKTIHEKVKAFSCSECPKKFAAKHTLEFHLNTHSGKKPFGCKWCSFMASDRSSVSKHQKKRHSSKT